MVDFDILIRLITFSWPKTCHLSGPRMLQLSISTFHLIYWGFSSTSHQPYSQLFWSFPCFIVDCKCLSARRRTYIYYSTRRQSEEKGYQKKVLSRPKRARAYLHQHLLKQTTTTTAPRRVCERRCARWRKTNDAFTYITKTANMPVIQNGICNPFSRQGFFTGAERGFPIQHEVYTYTSTQSSSAGDPGAPPVEHYY